MKAHTSEFKDQIKQFGRELDSKITYEIDNEEIELGSEELNSVSPHYEGAILKSVMKQLDIDSNVEIPIGTILRYQFGVKVDEEYEYIDFGNYVVYSIEKQEDTNSYKITCYDKMLYAMKDYENSDITFPINIKDYIEAICEKAGLTYEGSDFANSDKVIENELFLDNESRSMGYTFRDVLDQIAEVSGGTICINKDDELEVRYIHDVGEITEVSNSNIEITDSKEAELQAFELEGKTTQAETPTPDNPSDLVSVGYENLFDKDNINIFYGYVNVSNVITASGGSFSIYIPCESNTTYTIQKTGGTVFSIAYCNQTPANNGTAYGRILNNTAKSLTITTGNGAKYLIALICATNATDRQEIIDSVQIQKGTQAHSYIPYGKYGIEVKTTDEDNNSKTYLYTLDNPLRSIGNIKDLLYIKNGMLYVERKIGKAILDGSESTWTKGTVYTNTTMFYVDHNLTNFLPNVILSQYFKYEEGNNDLPHIRWGGTGRNRYVIFFPNNIATELTELKSWLSTHNTEVDYVLAEPYTEEIGQMQIPSTYDGITYIETTDELEPTMNISYMSEFEEIDEEYLKDVNVNFGEKFGPVNTIVLSRGGDGDKISLSIPADLPDDNKLAIQITDNQIMNGNDRNEYMAGILNQLYNLEYYKNDFTSTGICYLDLCDRYRIKIGDNSYKCVMFNDEVNITQGLTENIYTGLPEEQQQEYKYISSTDRGITQANIIAKKNEATITEYTQKIDDANNRLNAVETKQTETDRTINIMSTNIDDNGNITEVTTTTGFTFNADGMTISDSGTNFYALHRNDGTYYYDGGLDFSNIVGQYTKDGSKQKDLELFGTYYYGKEDINDTPMFVAQLYSDENGEECFGHFYNRGD